jgi:hypothetical protein
MPAYDPQRNRRGPGAAGPARGAADSVPNADAAPVDALLDRSEVAPEPVTPPAATTPTAPTPIAATPIAATPIAATSTAPTPITATSAATTPPEPADDERRHGALTPVSVPLPVPPADDGSLRKAIAAGAAGSGVGALTLWWYVSRRRRRG